jgi:hypothetical protein
MRSPFPLRPLPAGWGLLIAGATAFAGCHSYQPLTNPTAAVSQMVKVQFSQSRDLTGNTASGADTLLRGLSALEGRVMAASVDTLLMTVSKITDSLGERAVTTRTTVTIRRDPSVAVDVLAVDENRTAAVAGVSLAVVAYVAVIVAVVAILSTVRY